MSLLRFRSALAANPLAIDAVIALGLAALSLSSYAGGSPEVGPPGWATLAVLLLQSLPLVARRRYPVAVMLVIAGALILQIALLPTDTSLSGGIGVLIATYTVGERVERRTGLALTALLAGSLAVIFLTAGDFAVVISSLIQTDLVIVASWVLGDASRIRRLYAASLEERARMLEREREERAAQAVREERERIARELHDVVTHHVSVMVIQAGGAARVFDKRPEEARTALDAIAATGRQALTDMRRMLGILGQHDSAEPMPGLDRLDALVDQVRAAGLRIDMTRSGVPRPLDAGLEVSAYRIVQEALTNSLKHAGSGTASVSIHYGPDALELAIDDERGRVPAPPVEPAHEGRGLVGMRERVAMLHGTFDARPTAKGFRVTARLPLDAARGAA